MELFILPDFNMPNEVQLVKKQVWGCTISQDY